MKGNFVEFFDLHSEENVTININHIISITPKTFQSDVIATTIETTSSTYHVKGEYIDNIYRIMKGYWRD
jgi:hypothetical protein